jgi:hypothetical protein
MAEKGKTVPQLTDDKWILELAFLVDITYLSELKMELTGKSKLQPNMFSDVKAFKIKLKSLHTHINEQNLVYFPFCKIALESFIKPFECLMLKNMLTSFNSSEINFLQGSLNFYTSSACSKILLLLTLMRSPHRYKWR